MDCIEAEECQNGVNWSEASMYEQTMLAKFAGRPESAPTRSVR